MKQEQPAVVCAWCERLLSPGTTPISHGLCDACLPGVVRGAAAPGS